ncbi:MAG: hypothetical protein ACKVQR_07175 [Aquabacterium sp.]
MIRSRIAALACAALLAACASVTKISTGDVTVGERISMKLDAAWNQINLPGQNNIYWTQDGITIDALQWWVGVKDGQVLAEVPKDKRPLTFKASMQPHELAALFEGLFARDGSTFKLDRLQPTPFLGAAGFRIDFTLIRKVDEVTVTGSGWIAVRNNELHAMTFTAPRLGFFPRHIGKVEQIAAGAQLKG